jgi:hypothetical protein
MKTKTCRLSVIVCKHVAAGALITDLVPPSPLYPEDGTEAGSALCAACAASPSENVDDYAWACWDCVRKRLQ